MTTNTTTDDLRDTLDLDFLRDMLPQGSTVYTVLRRVSQSGMSRVISVQAIKDGEIRNLDEVVSRALGLKRVDGGVRVQGAGMDMGYHIAHRLASKIHGNGSALRQSWI